MKHLRRYPMPRLLLTLGLFLVLAPSVSTADEGIILRTSIEPKAGIWVGQQVRLLIDVLAREEVDLALRRVVQTLDVADGVVQRIGGDEVALLDVVEQEVLLPVLVLEPLVALARPRGATRPRSPRS